MSAKHDTIQPQGWPRPKGYANGMLAQPGRLLFVAGHPPGRKTSRLSRRSSSLSF